MAHLAHVVGDEASGQHLEQSMTFTRFGGPGYERHGAYHHGVSNHATTNTVNKTLIIIVATTARFMPDFHPATINN